MFESLNTTEITRLALVIGAFVALTYRNKYGVIPGGVIVPGLIIILFLISPIWCLTILALSFLVYFIYDYFLKKADYKRRTPMYILSALSLTIVYLLAPLYIQLGWLEPYLDSLSGGLMPAIIAFTWTKQKMSKVIKGILVTTAFTAIILTIIYIIGFYFLKLDFDTIRPVYAGKEYIAFQYPLIQFYIVLAIGYLIYRHKNIRSGGYLVAPAAALLMIHPLSAVLFIIGCFLIYYLTQLICKLSLTIGLNRYGLALFLSAMYTWSIEMLFLHLDTTILPFQGSNILAIIVMMSYVNDAILYQKNGGLRYMALLLILAIISLQMMDFFSKVFI
ncbi:MAG: poly-gamma-glutamate biosynthesis protein PgsC/CapC [Xenococcaceae cyanobacterium]